MITQVDPITLEVVSAGITSVVAEMNHSLFHSGYSTIIRESLDGTCGLLTLKGELVGLAVTHPSHLGGFEPGVASVLKEYPLEGMEEGDAYLVNHPYLAGNSHATDTVVVSPIFVDGEPIAFACDIAHKPDIGGLVPGTNSPNAREIFHEGLLVPPVRFYRGRQPVREIMAIVAANSRVPDLVLGDLRGQVGTNFVAERGVRRLCERYGKDMVLACFEEIIAATERRVHQEVATWPDGSHEGVGYLDGAYGRPRLKLHCRATVLGDEITLDFSETDDQVEGPLAIRPSVGRSITYAALCAMIDPKLWPNHGFDRATKTIFRPGSMLDPIFPAPINMYSKVAPPLIDVILAALGHFVPEKLVAAAGGATSNFNLGGRDVRTGRSYVQNEYMITALGGRPGKDGQSAIDNLNVAITPIEVIETEFPTRVLRTEVRIDSGGPGKFRGGLATARREMVLHQTRFTLRADRYETTAAGVMGGQPGRPGLCILNIGTSKEERTSAKVSDVVLEPGAVFYVAAPGAGGWGDPLERDPDQVLEDVLDSYVSLEGARKDYRVVIDPQTMTIDKLRTRRLRARLKRKQERETSRASHLYTTTSMGS